MALSFRGKGESGGVSGPGGHTCGGFDTTSVVWTELGLGVVASLFIGRTDVTLNKQRLAKPESCLKYNCFVRKGEQGCFIGNIG